MKSRRQFFKETGALAIGSALLPSWMEETKKVRNAGVQLYTFRKELAADVMGTLKQIAGLGIKQIESAQSDKGKQTIDEAAASGQEYIICSTMPTSGQTVDNYKKVAESFNKAGEECKKMGLKFGYHNHEYEFENENGQVLYDVLLANTNAELVHMEMDLGWVVAGGKNPLDYFAKHEGRFPLWHLKDVNVALKKSTEFGKGGLDIVAMLNHRKQSGLKYFFIEQEDYEHTPLESMQYNMDYLKKLNL
jgi:sugar phosphate isomerase/epimerase